MSAQAGIGETSSYFSRLFRLLLISSAQLVRTPSNPRRAEAAANAQADDYVKDRRAEWQRRTQRACYNARQAVEQARRDHAQNEEPRGLVIGGSY